ncbi:glycosyltransferase family 1 protein, partial [Candidatus Gottesmanbacteria bacterium]|nr:glycosyltransferase family 1 protein [Candidatus Gottesmanbacteria bacterium]
MRILWLNWRDIKNPNAGGAEIMTHQTAKRLVKAGHTVTIITSKFKNCAHQDTIDGVKIIRKGNLFTCRIFAFLEYQRHFKNNV